MFIDEKKAGMSRSAAVKALQAEGVSVSECTDAPAHLPGLPGGQWWRHMPVLPRKARCRAATRSTDRHSPAVLTSDQPEPVEQYVAAFEKVWAHRKELGRPRTPGNTLCLHAATRAGRVAVFAMGRQRSMWD